LNSKLAEQPDEVVVVLQPVKACKAERPEHISGPMEAAIVASTTVKEQWQINFVGM